jgi:pimeloyl-ACP methyl ester carboxylesterase
MSAPFAGPPSLSAHTTPAAPTIHEELATLPRPRKHYHWYYSTQAANDNMWRCSQGVHNFLRAYYHFKSADWKQNQPVPLEAWTATELAKLPTYYIMDLHKGMAETVAPEMPSDAEIATCNWLSDEELLVCSTEYARTGFQGGLQAYRISDLRSFSGRTIDVPSLFISGASDWNNYQVPGALERMKESATSELQGIHFVQRAGHWVQQEQSEEVNRLLLVFLGQQRTANT